MRRASVLLRLPSAIWLLAWFALYLEVYRYRHVELSDVGRILWPAGQSGSRPGGFVRAVVLGSLLAPVLAAATWVWMRRRGAKVRREPVAPWFAAFGAGLALLGTANQLMRRPPFVVDLTLRTGNGGFIVLGSAIAAVAVLVHARRKP